MENYFKESRTCWKTLGNFDGFGHFPGGRCVRWPRELFLVFGRGAEFLTFRLNRRSGVVRGRWIGFTDGSRSGYLKSSNGKSVTSGHVHHWRSYQTFSYWLPSIYRFTIGQLFQGGTNQLTKSQCQLWLSNAADTTLKQPHQEQCNKRTTTAATTTTNRKQQAKSNNNATIHPSVILYILKRKKRPEKKKEKKGQRKYQNKVKQKQKKNPIGEFKSNTEVMVARLNTKTLTSWCDADGEIGWFIVLVGMMNVILLAANDQVAADRWHDVDVRPRRPWGPSRCLSMTHDLLGSCSDLPIEFGAIVATVQYSVQIWASTAFVLLGQNRPNSPPLTAKS